MGKAGSTVHREPWNKGKLVGQKAPFKLKDIRAPAKPLRPPPLPKVPARHC